MALKGEKCCQVALRAEEIARELGRVARESEEEKKEATRAESAAAAASPATLLEERTRGANMTER